MFNLNGPFQCFIAGECELENRVEMPGFVFLKSKRQAFKKSFDTGRAYPGSNRFYLFMRILS
mgnify:CR=1 FL=1